MECNIDLSQSISDTLSTDFTIIAENFAFVSENLQICWATNGNRLEVFNTNTGRKVSSFKFGHQLHSAGFITASSGSCFNSLLIIATTSSTAAHASKFYLYVLDITSAQIVSVILFPSKITSIEFIPKASKPKLLGLFDDTDRVAAVGTHNGYVYLLDLHASCQFQSTESCPASLYLYNIDDAQAEMSPSQHFAVQLPFHTANAAPEPGFEDATEGDVYVSGMKFISNTNQLLVGLSSGSVQICNLHTFDVDFICSEFNVHERGVKWNFIFQEPENDPKHVCFLWLIQLYDSHNKFNLSQVTLVQMLYQKRKKYAGTIGCTYEGYINARARFSYQLDCTGSTTYRHLLSSSLITAKSFRDNHDDCVFPETMVLLWLESEDPLPVPSSSSSQIFIMTFNMNQWYLSGMPARWEDSRFMQIHHLGMLAQLLLNQHILHVSVGEKPASYYLDGNNQAFRAAPDYGLTCITGQKIVHISLTSEFTQFIKHLEKVGTGLLKDLDQVLNLCLRYNLLNSLEFPADEDGQVIKHKALLTVLMRLRKEKLLIDFIHCSLHSNVDQSCMDVETLAEWALQSVELTCETFNNFMHPIFEYGSLNVDDHSMDTTDQCVNSFNLLINFITSLLTCCSSALSLQTCEALKSRLCVSFLMEDYMQASIWTVTCLFLHHSHGSNTFEKLKTDCLDGYGKRRASRRLLIDYIMNCNDNGSNKFDRYEDDEEMINDGKHATLQKYLIECQQKPVYPLASINTLLGVYLLWDVSMATKHAILMYFTRDVLHEHKKAEDVLESLQLIFNVPHHLVQIIHACWLLDHDRFKESFQIFKTLKATTFPTDMCHAIIRTYLHNNELQCSLSLSYKLLDSKMDVSSQKLFLEVLLSNKKIRNAFEFWLKCSGVDVAEFTLLICKFAFKEFLNEINLQPFLYLNSQYKHLCLRVIQIIINNNLVTNIQQAEGLKRMIVGVDWNLSSTAFRFTNKQNEMKNELFLLSFVEDELPPTWCSRKQKMFNSGGMNLKGVNETDKVLLKSCMLNTIPSQKMSLGGVYHSILSKHSSKVCSSMFQDSTFRMQKKHLRFSVSSPSKSWEKNIEAWNIKENTFLSQKLIQRLDDNDDFLDKDDAITSRHIEPCCNEIVDTSRTNMDVDKIVIASESNTDSSLASTQADKIIKSEGNNTSVDEIDRSLTSSDTSVSNNSSLFLTDTQNGRMGNKLETTCTNLDEKPGCLNAESSPVSFIGSHDDCNLQRSESDLPRADLSQLVRPPLRRAKNNDSPRASKLTPSRRSSRRSHALTEMKHNLHTAEPVSSMSTSSSYHIDTLPDTSIQKSSSHIKNENYKEENEVSTSSSQKINDNLNDDVNCQICFSCAAREETVETNDRHDPGVVEFKSFIQDINFRTPVKRPKGDHDVGRQSSRKSVSKLKKHMNKDDGDGSGEKKLQQAEECHEPVKKSLKMDEYSIEPNERLTPAQRLIRSKRLNKKINSEDNKPLNDQHVKMLPNVSDHFSTADIKNADTTFKFSNPSVKHTKRKSETRSGSMKFVFSPPLTRARQKKQIDGHDETKNKR